VQDVVTPKAGSGTKWWPAVLAVAVGVALGFAGDLLDGRDLSASQVGAALLLSPLAGWTGPIAVTVPGLVLPLSIGAFLFLPVEVFLIVRWRRRGNLRYLIVLCAWTAQAYFQMVHRMDVMMSA
jgi:hypothetical protein